MCSKNPDGTITTCSAHADMTRLAEKLTASVEQLSTRVFELEKTIRLLRNAAFLLVGLMMGTGILQVKEVLTLLGN
jgi:hypothetical protein